MEKDLRVGFTSCNVHVKHPHLDKFYFADETSFILNINRQFYAIGEVHEYQQVLS